MEIEERIREEVETLRTVRDELRLQVHLASADAKTEWERLEKRWEHLEGRAKVLREASKESLDDITSAASLLVDEVKEGYRELRSLL